VNIKKVFPSKYLKADDLGRRRMKLTIGSIDIEDIGGEEKPVIYFDGHVKGCVVNKTNATGLAMILGDETDDWIGKEIALYAAPVLFQGKQVMGMKMEAVPEDDPAGPDNGDDKDPPF